MSRSRARSDCCATKRLNSAGEISGCTDAGTQALSPAGAGTERASEPALLTDACWRERRAGGGRRREGGLWRAPQPSVRLDMGEGEGRTHLLVRAGVAVVAVVAVEAECMHRQARRGGGHKPEAHGAHAAEPVGQARQAARQCPGQPGLSSLSVPAREPRRAPRRVMCM